MTSPDAADAAPADLQERCAWGQQLLMETRYWEAERVLAEAEDEAWRRREFDTLARLYMPLQECRRQRRQRCGEAVVCLDLIAQGPGDQIEGRHVVENYPAGQLLVAGWGSFEPARQVRRLQAEHGLYLETFLAAAFPADAAGDARVVVVVPTEDVILPEPEPRPLDELLPQLPPHSLVLPEGQLPRGSRRGTWQTYAEVMALWERLHAPFLAAADARADPAQKIEGYRMAVRVDYACELAHQKLSDVAKSLSRASHA